MKKKVLSILLSLALSASLTACGTKAEATNQDIVQSQTSEENATEEISAEETIDTSINDISTEELAENENNYDEMDAHTAAMFIFIDILENGGIKNSGYDMLNPDFYDIRYTEEEAPYGSELYNERKYELSVNIPTENTEEWAKEKLQLFLDNGVTYYYLESYGFSDYCTSIALWLLIDENTALTHTDMEQFFQNDVDNQIKEQQEKDYEEWLNSQQ